jgi:hypothetical protein
MTPKYYAYCFPRHEPLCSDGRADLRQRLSLEGALESERSKAEQFREFADEAFQWSRKPRLRKHPSNRAFDRER